MSNLKTWWRTRTLQSEDVDVRLRAIEKLGGSRDPQAFNSLVAALKDPEPEIRACAVAALGNRVDPRAADPLIKLVLGEKIPEVFSLAADALGMLPTARTVPPLLRALNDSDASIRHNAASALRKAGWVTLEPVDRARIAIVQNAWDEVAKFGPAAVDPLSVVFREGTAHLKREAAVVLGALKNPKAMRVLVDTLINVRVSRDERELAAWALRKYYAEQLDDCQWAHVEVIEGAWSEVAALGEAAIEPLRLALRDPDHSVRRRAAETFGAIRSPRAAAPLVATLGDQQQDVEVREIVARLLAKLPAAAVTEALVSALADEGWKVREAAAAALRECNWQPGSDRERAALAVVECRWDDVVALGAGAVHACASAIVYARVGFDAARTLVRMGPPGIDAMVAMLRDSEQPSAVRELVATVLADVGDQRAMEPMAAMLDDPDVAIRQTAVWTLEKLGWQPADEKQRASAAIAHEDWDGLARCGAAAVEPLLNMITADMAPVETTYVLLSVLERHASRLTIKQLRVIVGLCEPGVSKVSGALKASADTAKVQQLARFELIRRGIMF